MNLQLTTDERAYVLKELTEAEDYLKTTLSKIDDHQFVFKPEKVWSLAECLEHILLFNTTIFGIILRKAEAIRDTVPETQHSKEKLVAIMQKRRPSYRVQAPANLVPTGKFQEKKGAIQEFSSQLATIKNFVEATDIPLRKIAFKHMALGLVDGVGWLSMIGGHTKRHIMQMEEVIARADFPK